MQLLPFHRHAIYLLDAAGSALLGLAVAGFSGPLAAVAGPALPPGALLAVGLGLLPWALFNLWIGTRAVWPAAAVLLNVAGDALWVGASLALLALAGPALAPVGAIAVGGLAAVVAAIGLIKAFGLRRRSVHG